MGKVFSMSAFTYNARVTLRRNLTLVPTEMCKNKCRKIPYCIKVKKNHIVEEITALLL